VLSAYLKYATGIGGERCLALESNRFAQVSIACL